MSKQTDSFLPSGAIASPPAFSPGNSSSNSSNNNNQVSSMYIPRTVPELTHPFHRPTTEQRPHLPRSQSGTKRNNRPISPPKTRSTSAEDSMPNLVEDWRAYTSRLRTQFEGERAHMMADRAMADQVMNEERALWEEERTILKSRIAELEGENASLRASAMISPVALSRSSSRSKRPMGAFGIASAGSNAASTGSSVPTQTVPQESGRNADGTPFYAPTARHPCRTFGENPAISGLRVDTLSAPGESPIQVTKKELTSSDFGSQNQMPHPSSELESIPETTPEAIDISLIQPGLEGINILTSALAPEFIAKVISPMIQSPAMLSPNIAPPAREVHIRETLSPLSRDRSAERQKGEKVNTQTLLTLPENERQRANAGHTPKGSVTHLPDLVMTGNSTPSHGNVVPHVHVAACSNYDGQADEALMVNEEDPVLTGHLGLTNNPVRDELFLAGLTQKLEEVIKSAQNSPVSEPGTMMTLGDTLPMDGSATLEDDEGLEMAPPRLKMKPSMNFGRPLGRI